MMLMTNKFEDYTKIQLVQYMLYVALAITAVMYYTFFSGMAAVIGLVTAWVVSEGIYKMFFDKKFERLLD